MFISNLNGNIWSLLINSLLQFIILPRHLEHIHVEQSQSCPFNTTSLISKLASVSRADMVEKCAYNF